MASSLEEVGGQPGGEALRRFLAVSHNDDGTLSGAAGQLFAAANALVFKGVIDCSANPNYPAASVGHLRIVSVAGKIGGGSGTSVSVGDMVICTTDNAGGTQASVGADFSVVHTNAGTVTGPVSSATGDFATFNGASGAVIQDSGVKLDTDTTLVANSDTRLATQKATKTYADQLLAATNSNSLSYTQVTVDRTVTSTTESAGDLLVDPGAVTFDGSPCLFEFFCPRVSMPHPAGAGAAVVVSLFEGSTQIGRMSVKTNPTTGAWITEMSGEYRFTPSPGAHHYKVTAHVSADGAVFVGNIGGPGNELPMTLQMTRIRQASVSVATPMVWITRYPGNGSIPTAYEQTVLDPPPQAIDATNLTVSFNLPVESDIIVRLQGWHDTITTHASQVWGLVEGGVFVPGSGGVVDRTVQSVIGVSNPYIGDTGKLTSMDIYLQNVAAGTHKYDWAWSNGDNMRLICGDGTTQDSAGHIWPPAYMIVSRVS